MADKAPAAPAKATTTAQTSAPAATSPAPASASARSSAPAGTRTTKVVEVESDATAAAGPHRPEPAKQIFHNPGNVPVDPNAARKTASTYRQRVRATQDGYYGEARRRTGDVFTITDAKHFSHKWMEAVDGTTPEKVTTGQQTINQKHDETLARQRAERTGERLPATGDGHVIDDDE